MAPSLNFLLPFLILVATDSTLASFADSFRKHLFDKGTYCQSRTWKSTGKRWYNGDLYSECCNGRVDDCSVPILGTLCYCDQFCDRGETHDCCPDYWRVCRGATTPKPTTTTPKPPTTTTEPVATTTEIPPETYYQRDCEYEGKNYTLGQNVSINCNLCRCVATGKWNCSKELCLMDHNVSSTLQQMQDLDWTPVNVDFRGNSPYVTFMNRTLNHGLTLRLGTINPYDSIRGMQKIQYIVKEKLPHTFDGRERWNSLLTPVLDQGWCASSWALSATTVISDRAAISDTLEKRLKYEHFLDCYFICGLSPDTCSKGRLDLIWKYLSLYGAPEEKCVKEVGPKEGQCRSYGECRRFKSGPAYRLADVNRMQHNIMVYGPLQATIRVYHDFFHYERGVYNRPGGCNTTEPYGYHSVRIIGWGVDNSNPDRSPIPYWLVANSWGTWWGEGGYFRIRQGVNECEIESYVLSAWVHPELAYLHNR